jgi:hypothetical protein
MKIQSCIQQDIEMKLIQRLPSAEEFNQRQIMCALAINNELPLG